MKRLALALPLLFASLALLNYQHLVAKESDDFTVEGPEVFGKFQDSIDPGTWSLRRFSKTLEGDRLYLGPIGAESLTLWLRSLPQHQFLRVKFELFILDSWDGSNPTWGPDVWKMSVVGGQDLIRTTFSNCDLLGTNEQAYPDNIPCPHHPARTGASENHTLGYKRNLPAQRVAEDKSFDSVYAINVLVPHTDRTAVLRWSTEFTDSNDFIKKFNNQWGIANFQISLVKAALPITPEQFEPLWEKLGDPNPEVANRALWKLVASSDAVTPLIAERLVADSAALAELPRQALRRDALRDDPLHWRIRRAKRVLEIINSGSAKKLLWGLNKPDGKFNFDVGWYEQFEMVP